MMCRRNILHALLSPHKQYVNSVCSQNWITCMNGCGLSSFQSIHLHNILLTKIAFQKSQWFPLKTLVKRGHNNNNNNNTSLIWCRWPVVQGLRRAYQDKQDFYWCAEATLARCPSCHHQWLTWVPAAVEPRLALAIEPWLLIVCGEIKFIFQYTPCFIKKTTRYLIAHNFGKWWMIFIFFHF